MKYFITLLAVLLLALSYFLLPPNIAALSQQVNPTVSLYPNSKSLKDKFQLIDDQGNATSLSATAKGKWTILYFGYASCPDVCPVDLATLSQTLGLMKHADSLQVVFISVDPKRDIGNMNDFAQRFNSSFVGLSAEKQTLAKLTKFLGVYHQVVQTQQRAINNDHSGHGKMQMKKPANNYLLNHTASYLLLNPDIELTGLLTNPHRATKMALALDLIIQTLD